MDTNMEMRHGHVVVQSIVHDIQDKIFWPPPSTCTQAQAYKCTCNCAYVRMCVCHYNMTFRTCAWCVHKYVPSMPARGRRTDGRRDERKAGRADEGRTESRPDDGQTSRHRSCGMESRLEHALQRNPATFTPKPRAPNLHPGSCIP